MKIDNGIVKKFHSQIGSLIELNHYLRATLPECFHRELSPSCYALEYCTVRIDVGRQAGKTTYIKRYHNNLKTLVVVSGMEQAREYEKKLCLKVMIASKVMQLGIGDYNDYDMIFFEEPMFIFKRFSVESLYNRLTVNTTYQTFVHLGM